MKVLSDSQVTRYGLVEAKPQMQIVHAFDKVFAFDSNSMMFMLLENPDEVTVAAAAGVAYKPNIPLMSRPFASVIVFQACYACNLRCRYCFVAKKFTGTQRRMLSIDTFKKTLDRFFPDKTVLPKGKQSIGFFGGEPLMNWQIIDEGTTLFEKLCHPRTPTLGITTNATLLTKERVEWFSRRPCFFVVSIDGPKEIHDSMRVTTKGEGSFDKTMEGLSLLKKAGLGEHVTLRATFSPETVGSLLTRTQFLNKLRYEGYGNNVSIEPAFLSESTCVDPEQLQYSMDSVKNDFYPRYLEVAKWLIAEVRAGRKPRFQHLTKAIERVFYGIPNVTDCGAGMQYLSVDPAGDIFACHRPTQTKIGNIYLGGIDEGLRCPWVDNRLYRRETCPTCSIRHVCGGGCREESMCKHGNTTTPVKAICSFRHMFFNVALWIISELTKDQLRDWIKKPGGSISGEKNGTKKSEPATEKRRT